MGSAVYFLLLAPSIIHPSILCRRSSLTLSFFPSVFPIIPLPQLGFYLLQLNIYSCCSPSCHVDAGCDLEIDQMAESARNVC